MIPLLAVFFVLGLFTIIMPRTPLKSYSIPVSMVAAVVFLVVFTLFPLLRSSEVFVYWKEMPSVMIALVFACLFLERKEVDAVIFDIREVSLQGIFVWLGVLGQSIIGVGIVLFFFQPLTGLPPVFGMLLETGFAGGHGTAAAMGEIFERTGLHNGLDLGQFSATIGIVSGTIMGLILLKRDGYIVKKSHHRKPLLIRENVVKFSNQIFISGVLIGTVYFAGLGMQTYLLRELPLFVYALLASVVLKYWLHFIKWERLIYTKTVEALNLVFSEILIFTGIATIDVKVILDHAAELSVMFVLGLLWSVVAIKKLLPFLIKKRYLKELAMVNFGMMTGTTATGIMFLKIIDPEIKGDALRIYGKAAPLSSPFVGGGLITLSLPWLLFQYNSYLVFAGMVTVWLIVFALGILMRNR